MVSFDIVGNYFCNNQGKRISLNFHANNTCVFELTYTRVTVVDTLTWHLNNDIIYFSDIDTNYIDLGDTIALIAIPEKALCSDNHILFFQNKSLFLFYNTAIDTGYKTEDFYFINKRLSGEEEQTINELFGDRITILMKLGYLQPLNILSLYNQSHLFRNRKNEK